MTQSNEDKQFFQPQFRGVTIPADIWLLNIKREITDSQMKLLLIIDSLVKPKGAGCWASCEYLAGSLNLSERQIKTMMGELKEKGLLIEVGEVTIRNLKHKIRETSWSRTEKTDHATRLAETKADLEKILKCPMKVYIFTGEVDFTCRGEANRMSRGEAGFTQTNTPHSSEYLMNKEKKHPRRPGSGGECDGTKTLLDGTKEHKHPWQVATTALFTYALKHQLIISVKSTPTAWAKPVQQLLKAVPLERVLAAIGFLDDNIHWQYCPQVCSGHSLWKKFPNLERAMERRNQEQLSKDMPPTSQPPIELDKYNKRLLQELEQLHWPKGSIEQLPQVIVTSVKNFDEFSDALVKVAKTHIKNRTLHNLSEHMYRTFSDQHEFVKQWLSEENERVQNWDAWSGKITVFTRTHKRFRQMGREIATDYSGDANVWDELIKVMEAT